MNHQSIKVACSNCNLRELCLPVGLSSDEVERLDQVVSSRRKIKKGEALYHSGEAFTSLYAIRTGFFKTCLTTDDGREQITGFQMAGEIMGLDGITTVTHWPWKTPRCA
jgi:CRP/FNR family transcriptional regulator